MSINIKKIKVVNDKVFISFSKSPFEKYSEAYFWPALKKPISA